MSSSIFFICQFFTAIPWGRFSDRRGRRPVMLTGLIGNTVSTCCFGLSKNLWWALGSRAICGIVNGNSGVARSMVTEITDETNRAAAFSVFGFCWGIGLIGGYLCKPAEHFPNLFGNVQFLKDYPYFLPCFVSAIGSFCGFLLGYFYLKETNPAILRRNAKKNRHNERTALLSSMEEEEAEDAPVKNSSKLKQITRASYAVIIGYAMFAFQSLVFDEILPLFFSAPIAVGGLGQDTTQVAEAYTLTGIQQIFLQFVVFPKVSRYFSTLTLTRFSMILFIFVYVLFPELSTWKHWISIHIVDPASHPWLFKGAYFILLFLRYCGNCFSFTSYMIMTSNSAAPEILGTVNG
ncbi:hypothetical protein EC973_004902 [Apophysomyces ossiformis]|uniref:Major facilitator superfamily (MFS) profile domain-containing protein n=1 Tax=Apophysomyces ossiformis TaxID=679940 RepID=A0A8H7ESC2_9FUNG|nr:hypothetical protein EC973_004902 [Apophysomyces ossiformis]